MEKTLKFLGLNINLKKEIKTIVLTNIISYIIILILIILKMYICKETLNDIKLLAIKGLSLSGTIGYGIFCLIQEVLARGILQRSIKRKTNNTIIAITITTILFCLCHFNYNIKTIIGAFFISIITGIITDKRDDILVSFIFHWIIGGLGYVFIAM